MTERYDITLIGAGIMSATLGVLIKQLMPDARIAIYERLDRIGAESSDAWNNAGTGHSAFCELNYTPALQNGSIDISKALKISSCFEVSKQFWAYLKEQNYITSKEPFINDIDHMSFVWGDENTDFLRKRYEALVSYGMFSDMKFSNNSDEILDWIPLIMEGRDRNQKTAATRMEIGTDVNFGGLTRSMIMYLDARDGVDLYLGYEVKDLTQIKDGNWRIELENLHTGEDSESISNLVFIGAGGGALPLLEKSDIPEARGYGGFPISGQFLKCTNQEIIVRHEAKVYGMAETGSPPMSVPHLDTRMLDNERSLLFGPYAGFSTKFLKNGSYLDLPLSIEVHNAWPLLSAGVHNLSLTKYLIEQVFQSTEDRMEALRKYYPQAQATDWELITAGQRVQIIKGDPKDGGVLKFGTEIVSSSDKTLAALLGASPGASTSVSIMIDVLQVFYGEKMTTSAWKDKISQMIPSYGKSLIEDPVLCKKIRDYSSEVLKLVEE